MLAFFVKGSYNNLTESVRLNEASAYAGARGPGGFVTKIRRKE
jgi:hypothetical protein